MLGAFSLIAQFNPQCKLAQRLPGKFLQRGDAHEIKPFYSTEKAL
jgi:hypothetical protein